ncbi:MAG: hypothetical protein KAT69_09535 [Candidatus Aminicenantes bacterium]|nr:hypothetical protein [Candidatus Aminicenantes bacterium]
MSYTKYERGRFIKSRMNHFILMALGKEEIDAAEASRIFDLISDVETAGTTHSQDLVKEPFYLQAVEDWRTVPERRSRDRLIPRLRKLLKLALLAKIQEAKNARKI